MKKLSEILWYLFVVALAAVAVYVVCSSPVRAETSFQAGAGWTKYGTENGRWYQNGAPQNSVTSNSFAFSLGLTGDIVTRGNWGIDWRAEYVNLGRAAASCQCKTNDQDYASGRDGPTAFFSGSGRAQGIAMTVEPYTWRAGLRWGLEAGAYVYHAAWNESVTGWTVNDAPRQNLSMGNHSWNVAPVVGVTVGDGRWSASYRHYFMRMNGMHANVPPLWKDADVIELKWRF